MKERKRPVPVKITRTITRVVFIEAESEQKAIEMAKESTFKDKKLDCSEFMFSVANPMEAFTFAFNAIMKDPKLTDERRFELTKQLTLEYLDGRECPSSEVNGGNKCLSSL